MDVYGHNVVFCKCMYRCTNLKIMRIHKCSLWMNSLSSHPSGNELVYVCINGNITCVCVCVHAGLRDMLQMIAHQWQELQRQIRRQHGWMLRTLDTIKAQVLATERDQDSNDLEDRDLYASSEVWPVNPIRRSNLTPISCTSSLLGSSLLPSFESHSTLFSASPRLSTAHSAK